MADRITTNFLHVVHGYPSYSPLVMRLNWAGVEAINIDTPVKYLSAAEGGVSHFKYGRDNLLLSWMHGRLLAGFVARLPRLLSKRFFSKASSNHEKPGRKRR